MITETKTHTVEKPTLLSIEEMKRDYTLFVLKQMNWNKMSTSRTLKISIKTLYNWLDKWGYKCEIHRDLVRR